MPNPKSRARVFFFYISAGCVTLEFTVVSNLFAPLIVPRLLHFFLVAPLGAIPTSTLPLSQEETNIVLVEKYWHPGHALFIVCFTVKTCAIFPKQLASHGGHANMVGTHRAGVVATNGFAWHTKNLNVTDPKKWTCIQKYKCDCRIMLDISLACPEWNAVIFPGGTTAERDFPVWNTISWS